MSLRPVPLVAHVIFKLDYGGLENGVVNIVNRMPRDRYRHAIVCLAGYGREFRKRIRRDDVQVIPIGKRPGKDLQVYWLVWKTLRQLRPDIVHTRNLGTVDMQWMALAAGVPHRVHGEHGWEASDPYGQNRKNLRIRRACRPAIHRYVPMSRDLANWLERDVSVDPGRIRQLYSGVDTDRFTPSPARADDPDAPMTMGTVGRLDPVKNHEQLLRAFRAILDAQPALARRLRLLVVGDGSLWLRLNELARDLDLQDKVEFTGACNETPEQLRRMDLFVLPSVNEGISNTILEAMATGLPVVAGRVGGNPELVTDGVTGSLYDPADPKGLERALLRYAANSELAREHGAAGRLRAVQHFSLDGMVQRYVDLYDEVIRREPSPQPSPSMAGEGDRKAG